MKLLGFRIGGEGPFFTNYSINNYMTDYGVDRAMFVDGKYHMGTIVRDVFNKYYQPNNIHKLTADSMIYLEDETMIKTIIDCGLANHQSVKDGKLMLSKTVLVTAVLIDSGVKTDDFYTEVIIDFDNKDAKISLPVLRTDKQPRKLFETKITRQRWGGGKVIDEFTLAEQEIIRNYNKRCKETRQIRGGKKRHG